MRLSMREIRAMAQGLSTEQFREQLGPLALVERPVEHLAARHARARTPGEVGPTSVALPELVLARMLLLALETEDLQVATLPPIGDHDALTVGRQPDCDLVIEDESVSKRHAVLQWDQDELRCVLRDQGSTNGTFINSAHRIEGDHVLADGDIVSFGEVAFWFLLSETLHSRLAPTRSSRSAPPTAAH